MRVLFVDDSCSVRVAFSARLKAMGHDVVPAADGAEALARFREIPPDLVFMDIEMPGMNGFEVVRQIRAFEATRQWAWTPIIFLTATNTPENLVAAIDAGGDAFIAKSVPEAVFEAKMKAMARIAALRAELKQGKIFLLNLMSAPGSGKTTTLRRTIAALQNELRIGVMEADIDSDVDARAIAETGAKAIQLHTGGMCHLDAEMTRQGLEGLGPQDVDLVVLENVGNLVCPAEFDTGAVKNAMILSVPEGDDKPLKYPLMFQVCDVVLINKIDVLPYFDFDMDKCREYIAMRNPNAKVIPICAKTGEGIAEWTDWLREQVKAWQA